MKIKKSDFFVNFRISIFRQICHLFVWFSNFLVQVFRLQVQLLTFLAKKCFGKKQEFLFFVHFWSEFTQVSIRFNPNTLFHETKYCLFSYIEVKTKTNEVKVLILNMNLIFFSPDLYFISKSVCSIIFFKDEWICPPTQETQEACGIQASNDKFCMFSREEFSS